MRPKIIITCFAGRKSCMGIFVRYVHQLYNQKLIDEFHIWDFVRNPQDQIWLDQEYKLPEYAKIFRVKNKNSWAEYYGYYSKKNFPNHVIIKSDDDIVFLDTKNFGDFINTRIEHKGHLLAFPSIINNGVSAYHQKQNGLIPEDILPFNPDPMNGQLWESGALCEKLHDYFIENRQDWLSKTERLKTPINLPIGNRFSINFFAILSRDLNVFLLIKDRIDDEDALTVFITKILGKGSYLDLSLTVSHLSFQEQVRKGFKQEAVLAKYESIAPLNGIL